MLVQAPDEHLREGRLACAGRPDDANPVARIDREGDALERRLFRGGKLHDEVFDIKAAAWNGKLHLCRFHRNRFQHRRQPLAGLAERQELLPFADRLFDGGKGARDLMIEAAIMVPGVISCKMAVQMDALRQVLQTAFS